jgi:hypothetical protein
MDGLKSRCRYLHCRPDVRVRVVMPFQADAASAGCTLIVQETVLGRHAVPSPVMQGCLRRVFSGRENTSENWPSSAPLLIASDHRPGMPLRQVFRDAQLVRIAE